MASSRRTVLVPIEDNSAYPVRTAVRRNARPSTGAGMALLILLVLCAIGTAIVKPGLLTGLIKSEAATSAEQSPRKPARPAPLRRAPRPGTWNDAQIKNAATIVRVGKQERLSERAWVIAVATAMQESTLHNHGHLGSRNDHDSLGLFQQRPSKGWGTPAQVQDPEYAARKFYQKLEKVRGWDKMRLTVAAQRVQRSAFPEAYQKWEDDAQKLVTYITTNGLA